MYRIVIALMFAFAMVVGVIGSPTRSLALQGTATPEPTDPTELCAKTEPSNLWEDEIDVRPWEAGLASVVPLDSPYHQLYLVVWTIEPGTCIPYQILGHPKDGAIVLIVQEGVVEFTAEPYVDGSAAEVRWGNATSELGTLPFNVTQTLNPGDWVTQNDQVWFTLRAIGDENDPSAVILKAVWATPPPPGGGRCSGGCK